MTNTRTHSVLATLFGLVLLTLSIQAWPGAFVFGEARQVPHFLLPQPWHWLFPHLVFVLGLLPAMHWSAPMSAARAMSALTLAAPALALTAWPLVVSFSAQELVTRYFLTVLFFGVPVLVALVVTRAALSRVGRALGDWWADRMLLRG